MWRAEDEGLLGRLEDEVVLERLFRHYVGSLGGRTKLHARAAGLVASARQLTGGLKAVKAALDGDVVPLVRLVEAPPMTARSPELLHHVALFFGKVAGVLESADPGGAADAWVRALAAWLALGDERAYLAKLEEAVLGPETRRKQGQNERAALIPPERVPLELVADLGRRAHAAACGLAPPGRAALLALGRVAEAARIAGVSASATGRAQQAAERARNAAVDAALAVIGEALDEANVRGELTTTGRPILARALEVWAWSSLDEAVEQFVVDRLATVGWELYRSRSWDALRSTFHPFRTMIDHLAERIEQDPTTRIAFAAPCAQMFVFLTDMEPSAPRKLELAERAVRLCPTHRNGRLNLASLLCDQALTAMRSMVFFLARREELDRVEALLQRAGALYPRTAELPGAKAMLERVKRSRIVL